VLLSTWPDVGIEGEIMAADDARASGGGSERDSSRLTPGALIARQDRITMWALPTAFFLVIGAGFLFIFYDIFDINVSFIQTCTQIVPGCTPETAAQRLGLPTLLNLVGYVIGALGLTTIADRFGRRTAMLLTLAVTGIGALYTALVHDYTNFVFARFLTGIGIGADLAVVNTYMGEMSPAARRARYTALIFIMSALGAFIAIWLGLLLTTPPTAFPLGLPFALAGPSFENGWRVMYFLGAVLAVVGIAVRLLLPESTRWLVSNGHLERAEKIVREMEQRAARKQRLAPIAQSDEVDLRAANQMGYAGILRHPTYVRRTLLLLGVWGLGYVTVYTIGAGYTSVLTSLKYPPPEAGLIAAFGTFGFILAAVFATYAGESLERKYWAPIATVIVLVGGLLVAVAGQPTGGAIPWVAFIGSAIVFFGFNVWVPQTYAWSAENFPTRARATGFGLVDGLGHVGGGIGLIAIAPVLPLIGPVASFILIPAFLGAASVIAQFGVSTRGKGLEEISP
jgi:putative MFS transporter